VQLHEVLHKHFGAKRQGKRKEKSLFDKIYCDLLPVVRDPLLKKAAAKMEGKLIEFNRLREAMRITIAENNLGLNDNGDSSNIKTIEKAVEKFVKQIRKNKAYEKDEGYQKMIRQLEKYWSMLFADPIIVKTKTGPIVIQPQRTNNISEQHFRKLMRNYCKRNGFRAMEKTIRTMIAATPLVMNLKNQDYLDILLNGNTLAERFAEIDAEEVRDEMKRARSDADKMVSPKIKKIIKNPEFLTSLVALATAKKS
jgi:ribosomal protein S20